MVRGDYWDLLHLPETIGSVRISSASWGSLYTDKRAPVNCLLSIKRFHKTMRKLPHVYFITSSGRVVQGTAGIIAQGHMLLEAFWLYSAQREAKVGLFEMQNSNQTRRWSRLKPDCKATAWRDRMALAWRLTVGEVG